MSQIENRWEELYEDEENSFRDSIATVDKTGKRIWLYPKMPKGKFTTWRNRLSGLLLAVLFVTPFIKVNGEPLVLFNILERKFVLLGIVFHPQDFHLFLFMMLTLFVFVILFTVVFGRIFCGWVCPQTIFMENVFRKIEYWIEGDSNARKRLDDGPWTTDKYIKKISKHAIFYGISLFISNIFLAYIIGMDEVRKIVSEPISEHMSGFTAMMIFTTVFYIVFTRLREQVCTTICPYGRLQGVLLDKNSIVINYDWIRGEPRGKLKKKGAGVELDTGSNGDCIDCGLCVKVCPTGIDIRNGTQLECVNCTACIDACDEVMLKINKPTGLIRYDSYNGIAEGVRNVFTPRAMTYSFILLALIVANIFLISSRTKVETVIMRTPGKAFFENEPGILSNLYNYQITNKSNDTMRLTLHSDNENVTIKYVGNQEILVLPQDMAKGAFFIELPKEEVKSHKNTIKIDVKQDGMVVDKTKTNFLGPNR
jgi:cytochrome c oxidase accessory protein FixG